MLDKLLLVPCATRDLVSPSHARLVGTLKFSDIWTPRLHSFLEMHATATAGGVCYIMGCVTDT